MKKLFFIAAISLGVVVSANAQDTKFGAKAGVNLANVTGDVDETDMAIGFQVGGYIHLGISDAFAVQAELLFDNKGFNQDIGDDTYRTTLNYITVPILAKYMITEGLNIHAGPQIGILVSATDDDGDDISDGMKSTDFGIAAGAGYELESGLNFFARYSTSLSSVSDNDDIDMMNSVISIGVGFSF